MTLGQCFRIFLILLLSVAGIGMLLTIGQYLSFSRTVGFLFYKQYIVAEDLWRFLFYVHVFTCFVCLAAGFTQFSKEILRDHLKLHRVMGRIYFYNIVFVNFPAGLFLAIHANGDLPGKLAFVTLDLLWLWFTISAVVSVRRGEINRHRRQMTRSYAMTLTALTLRFLKMYMVRYSGWSYDEIYVFDAWMALAINLMLAEAVIYYSAYRSKRKFINSR